MSHYACWYGARNEGQEKKVFDADENVIVETSKRRALKFLWGKLSPLGVSDDLKDELERYTIAFMDDRWVSWNLCDCTNDKHGTDEKVVVLSSVAAKALNLGGRNAK
jgi:hypothetical protein